MQGKRILWHIMCTKFGILNLKTYFCALKLSHSHSSIPIFYSSMKVYTHFFLLLIIAMLTQPLWAEEYTDSQTGIVYDIPDPHGLTCSVKKFGDLTKATIAVPLAINIGRDKYAVTKVLGDAFPSSSTSKVDTIKIPKTVTLVCANAFRGNLTTLNLDCKEIGSGAISGNIQNLVIGANVSTIHEGFISNHYSVENITVDTNNSNYGVSDRTLVSSDNVALRIMYGATTVPSGVTRIGNYACGSDWSYINRPRIAFTIPSSVTTIGNAAFNGVYSMESITMGPNVREMESRIKSNIEVYSPYALPAIIHELYSGPRISVLHIPAGCRTAYEEAGWEADLFKMDQEAKPQEWTVSVIDGICYRITASAKVVVTHFSDASSLTYSGHVVVPTSVKIADVDYTVNGIDDQAFKGSTRLSELTLPATISRVGKEAFAGCAQLNKITILATVPPSVGSQAFDGCTARLDIPDGAYDDYSQADGWKDLDIIRIVSSLTFGQEYYALDLNQVVTAAVECHPAHAENQQIIWRSSDETILQHQGNGKFLGLKTGVADIIATAADGQGASASVKAYVNVSPYCATPVLHIQDGKVWFTCETEGASIVVIDPTFSYSFPTSADNKGNMQFRVTYWGQTSRGESKHVTTTLPISAGLFGDINGDGELNVADPINLSRQILERTKE